MPNMAMLGLSNIREIEGIPAADKPLAYYTKMQEASRGKDIHDWSLGDHGSVY